MKHIRKIENQLEIACIVINEWLFCNMELQTICNDLIRELEGFRKNANIATVSGIGTLFMGSILGIVGFVLSPITAGVSLGLSIGGGALMASGGTIITGAKVNEKIQNREPMRKLIRYQNCYQERLKRLQSVLAKLNEDLETLEKLSQELFFSQNADVSDFSHIQSLPGIVRGTQGVAMIPIGLLRLSSTTISIMGAVLGPITIMFDMVVLGFTVHNMAKGNTTNVTENLRRLSTSLYAAERQMHNWAYGNQTPCGFNCVHCIKALSKD